MASQAVKAKVVTIGDVSVGKTSLLLRYVKDSFMDNYNVTTGVEFLVKKIEAGNKSIALQLWDTAGHERFRSVVKTFFKDSACVVICFSLHKAVTRDEAEALAHRLGIGIYLECSAKENQGVDEVFQTIAKEIAEKGVPKPRHTLPGKSGEPARLPPSQLNKNSALGPQGGNKSKGCSC